MIRPDLNVNALLQKCQLSPFRYTFMMVLRINRLRVASIVALLTILATSAPMRAVELEVANYDIEVVLDEVNHRILGVERIRWTNTSGVATDELYFHLYLNAFAGSRTTFMRELGWRSLRGRSQGGDGWGWTRIDTLRLADGTDLLAGLEFVRPDDDNPDDFSVARVQLPEAVRAGGVVELEIEFEAQLPWIIARTGFVGEFHLVGQWFPKLAVFEGEAGWNCHQFHASSEFFADFGSYRVEMTIPEDWVVGATGIEVGNRVAGDGSRTVSYRADRVHDFAWSTAPPDLMEVFVTDFEPSRDVPMVWLERARRLLGVSSADLELRPLRLRFLVPRSQSALVPRMVRAARLSVAWFGLHYGPFPYPQLTIVSPPDGAEEAGGMEYPTFITTGADRLDAFPPYSWSPDIESVTAHEFGHQYFQGMVASNEFERGWLDEGVTTYAENSCIRDIMNDGLAPEIRPHSVWASMRVAPAIPDIPVTIARSSWSYRNRWVYFLASYGKMAVAMRTIEGLIGPQAMARGMRDYFSTFRFQHPTGRDLQAVLSEAAGQDLSWFFDQAVFADSTPDWGVMSVDHFRSPLVDGFYWNGSAWDVATGDGDDGDDWSIDLRFVRRGDFVGPVVFELTWADGSTERRVWDGADRWASLQLESPQRLLQVVVDPDGVWALETKRADNYWRAEPGAVDHPLWWMREIGGLLGRLFLRFS